MSSHQLFVFLFILGVTASTAVLSRAQYEPCNNYDNPYDHATCLYDLYEKNEEMIELQQVSRLEPIEALIWASREGYIDKVELLLDAGLSVDSVIGNMAVVQAFRNDHFDIVDLLEERGANS